jgi:ATP-dependent Clp protease ATP-binding subunit ClpA
MKRLKYSVYLSSRYIPDRFLPDKAIDLIDEAGARVKLRQATVPEEVGEVQKRVKFITHRMENGDRQPRVRQGAVLFGRRAQRKRKSAPVCATEIQAGRRVDGHCDEGRH